VKDIAKEYLNYIKTVFPDKEEIDAVEQVEMRRAFMAGARAMFTMTVNACELPAEQAMKKLTEFEQEFEEFMKMIMLGVA
jgi:hypothetical protein